jgi:hypothetical protein
MMRKFDRRLRKIAQLEICPFWMALMNVYPVVGQVNSFFAVSLVLGLRPRVARMLAINLFLINSMANFLSIGKDPSGT